MKIDKTISNQFVRVDMTLEEYRIFEKILSLSESHLKDYKGGAK